MDSSSFCGNGTKDLIFLWNYDNGIYYKEFKPEMFIYLLICVDDIFIICKNKQKVSKLKEILKVEFEMKNSGEDKRILGIDLKRDIKNGILSGYIKKL